LDNGKLCVVIDTAWESTSVTTVALQWSATAG
jgi:hypothetical protein